MSSPLQAEFFGEDLRCVLPSTVTDIEVGPQLYSQWKEWKKIGDNGKYPEMFRTIGGDPLTPGIDAGAYYFINNTDGWRIRPAEEDATVLIVGNLAPEDSTVDIAVPTLGAYTVLMLGLQPITQNVGDILTITQSAAFSGTVSLDFGSLNSGTTWPNGTLTQPVNNWTDAILIAEREGITKILFKDGNVVLDKGYPGWTFIGGSANPKYSIDMNGQDVSGCTFASCTLTGTAASTSPGPHVSCRLVGLSNVAGVNGEFHDCGFRNNFTLTDGDYLFHNCFSELAGTGKPNIDGNGANFSLSLRDYDGGANFLNFSDPLCRATLDANSAAPRWQASCTAGEFVIRGVGDADESLLGSPRINIVRDGWVDGKDVKLIKAMVSGDAVVSLDDLTVTVYDPDIITSPRTVLATFDVSADGRVRLRTS